MRLISTLWAVVVITPVVGPAQVAPPDVGRIDVGSRVRIAAPVFGKKKQVGMVVSVTGDTLVLRRNASSANRSVATSEITALEVSTGTHTRKAKGAFRGLLIGAGVGAVVGYISYREPEACTAPSNEYGFHCFDFTIGPTSKSTSALFVGAFGGIVGSLIGTLFGMRPQDSWVPASIAR